MNGFKGTRIETHTTRVNDECPVGWIVVKDHVKQNSEEVNFNETKSRIVGLVSQFYKVSYTTDYPNDRG
uniref:Uncharacterized protein n=1 Tax=Tetranychus urticae TaxID=32264 RepID=T1KCQ0_TETUR